MAADHRRKRINGVGVTGCSSWDHHRSKKKKLELQKSNLNAKSLISLEWDANHKKVVAKREQIGISWRDLRPFLDPSSLYRSDLADVLTVPPEVFELDNLGDVLPYEVWQTHLSEKEKKSLIQFIPEGQDTEEVIRSLLSGDNFHFGNPLLKWQSCSRSASLCLGNLHPDSVLHRERCLKSQEKAYYSELQTYHKGMIQYLQKLKDAWESTRDPGKEALQKIWRSGKDAKRRISACSNLPGFGEPGENIDATSESCSLVAEEKACSSDDENSPVIKIWELQKRIREKGHMKENGRNSVAPSDSRPLSTDKLQKCNVQHSDGAKYMSYLKISKKQYELVKSLKQGGKNIQSRTLNSVLGNVDTLHVQPYEEFVKEEQQKLQDHWLLLANNDLPAAYANWREKKFRIQEMAKSLDQEIRERLKSLEDQVETCNEIVLPKQTGQELSKHDSNMRDEEKEENKFHETFLLEKNDEGERNQDCNVGHDEHSGSDSLQSLSPQQISSFSGGYDLNPVDTNLEINQSLQNHTPQHVSVLDGGHDLNPMDMKSEDNKSPEQISSLSGGYDLNPMDMNSENNHVSSKSDSASPHLSVTSGNLNAVDDSNSQVVPITSGGDVWSAVSVPNTYYDSTANLEYPSTSGLALPHHINNEEQGSQLIDLEADVQDGGAVDYLLNRQPDNGTFSSYPNHSFSNHERNGLLQSVFKGQGISYNHQQKQTGLDFQPQNNMILENDQFPRLLQGQLHPSLALEEGQKRLDEDYMHHSLPEVVYPERGGYITPRQGHVPPMNMQDWNNHGSMSERFQSHVNDDRFLTPNWYPGGHQVRDGWASLSGANVPSQSMGSNVDQSLYSVFTQGNQLHSSSSIDTVRTSDQFVLPRNYGIGVGGNLRMSNTMPTVSHQLDYLSGRDAYLIPDDMGWMNLQQSSALHDPMGKSYLR
ncbi:hypothetical protein Tsubulata_043244 [Turnera subulata]|uniref:DEUBAD domain-containing protein n=1 Tax=Turnera subulata TaxID=218843 RepID=A0A9Q0GKW5_9ROSI|nr:hypothetical protein Tsubulata_043244 [Turnera subulata]